MHSKKAQAAFEYLVTYGWAILAALIAAGSLAYFGFINPTNLLPNTCSFGSQLECTDFRIAPNGQVNIIFRNNFGKPIFIADVNYVDDSTGVTPPHPFVTPIYIGAGSTNQTNFVINTGKYKLPSGDKKEVPLTITFRRADLAGSQNHTVVGYIYATVS